MLSVYSDIPRAVQRFSRFVLHPQAKSGDGQFADALACVCTLEKGPTQTCHIGRASMCLFILCHGTTELGKIFALGGCTDKSLGAQMGPYTRNSTNAVRTLLVSPPGK